MADQARKLFRFGVFEADASSGELRKSGVRLRLQEQPFQVLLVLLERHGEVVGREELRQQLWPADTFVDFDHSLNTIINKLREVLGDSASNPRFIETLAKRGYRFLLAGGTGDQPAFRRRQLAIVPKPRPLASASPQEMTSPASTSLLTSLGGVAGRSPWIRARVVSSDPDHVFELLHRRLGAIAAVEQLLDREFGRADWITVILIASAALGIPVRLYLLSAVSFDVQGLSRKFLKLFPGTFVLDQLWALSPFLLAPQIGLGLALGITAALIYVPFAQRTLVLMRERSASSNRG